MSAKRRRQSARELQEKDVSDALEDAAFLCTPFRHPNEQSDMFSDTTQRLMLSSRFLWDQSRRSRCFRAAIPALAVPCAHASKCQCKCMRVPVLSDRAAGSRGGCRSRAKQASRRDKSVGTQRCRPCNDLQHSSSPIILSLALPAGPSCRMARRK